MSGQDAQVHNKVVDLLSAYIDGEVTADEQALVESHVATCEDSAQELRSLRQTVDLMRQLPPMAAPRPFTLSEADVAPVRKDKTVSGAWWRGWGIPGLVGSAAALLCVVAAAGVFLITGGGFGQLAGAPQGQPVALEVQSTGSSPADEAEAVGSAEEAPAAPVPAPSPAAKEIPSGIEAEGAEPDFKSAGLAEDGLAREAEESAVWLEGDAIDQPAAEAPAVAEGEVADATALCLADEDCGDAGAEEVTHDAAQILPEETLSNQAESMPESEAVEKQLEGAAQSTTTGSQPLATPSPAPMGSPTPQPSAAPVILVVVVDPSVVIEPGMISARGRLPLPEGQEVEAELWRSGKLIDWALPQSKRTVVGTEGYFLLQLVAFPDLPGRDLFNIGPAQYEIRIRPVDPDLPVEGRIIFNTYSPPDE